MAFGVRTILARLYSIPLFSGLATGLLLGLSLYAAYSGTAPSKDMGIPTGEPLQEHFTANRMMSLAPAAQINSTALQCKLYVSGASLRTGSADECRKSCKQETGCNAWTWCEEEGGCESEWGPRLVYHGCELREELLAPHAPPNAKLAARLPLVATHGGHLSHHRPGQQAFLRKHSAPLTKVIVAALLPLEPCADEQGDLYTLMSVLNKQDYARWHGYDFLLASPDSLREIGPWTKLRLIEKLLDETPASRAEWILYVELDTLFNEIAFTFPFEMYAGQDKDLILLGDSDKIVKGDYTGVDVGVMLVRNSKRSRDLVASLLAHRDDPIPPGILLHREDRRRYDPVRITLAVLVKENAEALVRHMHFEGDFCLGCDWRRIDLAKSSDIKITETWGEDNENWKLFITRFYDCELCTGAVHAADLLPKCQASFREHYMFSYNRFKGLADAWARDEVDPLLDHVSELGIPINASSAWTTPIRNEVLKSGQDFHTSSSDECWQACLAETGCEMWVWCSHKTGCDSSGDYHAPYPYRSCQLMSLPKGVPPSQWERGPRFSSFSMGFITANHPANSWASRALGLPGNPKQQLVLLTGIPTSPCTTAYGDLLLGLQLQNKADWARLHGFEIHAMAEEVDSHMRPGAWQKIAYMRKIMAEVPPQRAEWILWVDMDIILADTTFNFPFNDYSGKDLVIWGDQDYIEQGDPRRGLNSGVVLLRNSKWTRKLLDDISYFGVYPTNFTREGELRAGLPAYEYGLFDQTAFTYLFKTRPSLMSKVHLEDDFCINCWYKDVYSPRVKWPPFVVHFAGCQMCSGFHPEKLGECDAEFLRMYADALARTARKEEQREQAARDTARRALAG